MLLSIAYEISLSSLGNGKMGPGAHPEFFTGGGERLILMLYYKNQVISITVT